MDITTKVENALKVEILKQHILKYFFEKGIKNVNEKVDPIIMQDIYEYEPLSDKVEVIPHITDISSDNDTATVEWNLFVLGTKRMNLGQTDHKGIMGLAKIVDEETQVSSDTKIGERELKTVKEIIEFIVKILEDTKLKTSGYDNGQGTFKDLQNLGNTVSQTPQFYGKNNMRSERMPGTN